MHGTFSPPLFSLSPPFALYSLGRREVKDSDKRQERGTGDALIIKNHHKYSEAFLGDGTISKSHGGLGARPCIRAWAGWASE
jgi:hypothetical protein